MTRNMRAMWRSHLVVAATAVMVVAASCGGGGQRTLTQTGTSSGWQTVQWGKAVVQVPSTWPVYNLSTDPTRCVRFDQHAVYLGHEGPDAACPAGLLGRTEAVQIEPLDSQARAQLLPGGQSTTINGQSASIEPFTTATHSEVAAFATLGVVVTVTWSTHEDQAQLILQSIHGG